MRSVKLKVLWTALLLLISQEAFGDPQRSLQKAAKEVGVPKNLLIAICTVESRLQPLQVNLNDGGPNNHAVGLCQVLISTATHWGLDDPKNSCASLHETCPLYSPDVNAYFAALVLRYQLRRYSGNWVKATAAYNAGSWRVKNNALVNQDYVDKVFVALEERAKD